MYETVGFTGFRTRLHTWAKLAPVLVVSLPLALGAAGCGSDASTSSSSPVTDKTNGQDAGNTNSQDETLTLSEYWAISGDAEMVQALLDLHKTKYPKTTVVIQSSTPDNMQTALSTQFTSENPPDAFTLHSGEVTGHLKKYGADSLYALDDFFASPSQAGLLQNMYPDVLSEVTVNGKIRALPVVLIRANTLFYNLHVFKAQQLDPPTTIEEFRTVCQKLKAAGIAPVGALWPGMIFQDLLPGVMGIEAFLNYMHGAAPDETALRTAIDLFTEVLDNYVDPSLLQTSDTATQAGVTAFMTEKTAMYISGDWTNGVFQALGFTPGVDFAVVDPPGSAGLVVYTSDALAIPSNAPHPQAALDFLGTVAAPEGQSICNQYKKTTPARKDITLDRSDPVLQFVENSFKNAKHRVPADTNIATDPVIPYVYSSPRDKEALLQALLTRFTQ